MAITIKNLAEALAELFGVDETEALSVLLKKGISSWSEFLKFLNEVRLEDKLWRE